MTRWELGEDGRYHREGVTLGPRAAADRLTKLERERSNNVVALQDAQRLVGALTSGRQPTAEQVARALQWLKSTSAMMQDAGTR